MSNNNTTGLEKDIKTSKLAMEEMVNQYMETKAKTPELEVRFTNRFTKIDYDNVVKQLYMAGYVCDVPEGTHVLRVMPEKEFITDKEELRKSKLRVDINGIELVEEYCRLGDDLKQLLKSSKVTPGQIDFTIKTNASKAVDFTDFNFRVSFQLEHHSSPKDPINTSTIEEWNNVKKTYRYLNRVRFRHPTLPFFADLSIVRGSRTKNRRFIPKYSVKEADVFDNMETYEVELEIDNNRAKRNSTLTSDALVAMLRQQIRVVLGAIQGTNYPIGNKEKAEVLNEYMTIIHGPTYDPNQAPPIRNRNFIGPSSCTLYQNCFLDPENNPKNILQNYCVTDKADGLRSLLLVTSTGRLYMIDMNMNVIFTGLQLGNSEHKKTFEKSILDGEFIKYKKDGSIINLYAAFDIYYAHGDCVSMYYFDRYGTEEQQEDKYRLDLLNIFVEGINKTLEPVSGGGDDSSCKFRVETKKFLKDAKSIFIPCKSLLENMYDDYNTLFEYNTDGIIFTPMNAGVGGEPGNKNIGKMTHKHTWDYSFKWKDVKYNTIDFLVKLKKNEAGSDDIQNHVSLDVSSDIKQYKTLVLHCGYSKDQHGFLTNPFIHMIHGTLPTNADPDNDELYKPVPFTPTNPYDHDAKYCNVMLDDNGAMKTLEGDYFEENTIIEFSYDANAEGNWKWKPLRVRHDKTAELLSNARHKGYGNDFRTANNVWTSIHYPVDREMLMTGKNIPLTSIMDDNVYYNKGDKVSMTKGLRDFHNLYVKKRLIVGASKGTEGNRKTLIDYAVGKAGDLSKWKEAKLDFIFGIDVHRDNIENHVNGACARYLNEKMAFRYPDSFRPKAMFVTGNSEDNIRDGSAFDDQEAETAKLGIPTKSADIAKAVFGLGTKDKDVLGKGVYDIHGYGEGGFNISSCQFALHYFFKDVATVHSFLRNVAECTKLNGYFVGTCYDGQQIFQTLQNKHKGDKFTLYSHMNGSKIVEITKDYAQEGFVADSTSVGYRILVFQETINKTFGEYLVHFEYLKTLLGHYGLEVVSDEKAKTMGLPNGSGLFSELYQEMEKEIARPNSSRIRASYGTAWNMTKEEKQVSFLNRYFVFQKVRDNIKYADIQHMLDPHVQKQPQEEERQQPITLQEEPIVQPEPVVIKKAVKIKAKKPGMKKTNEKVEI
jgi:mRNA capping enzyme/mRNA capping enzyme, catalytic domain